MVNRFINSNNQIESIKALLNPMAREIVLFVGPFILGLGIMLIIFPILLCCCICPRCCPPKLCRKDQNAKYTNFYLVFPVGVMVLAVLLIGVSSIVGISRAGKIVDAYESVGCSIAITLDDVINGNLSTSGTYFVGLKVLASDMGKLNGNLSNVNNQLKQLSLSNTSSTLSQTYTAGTNLLNTLSQVPNGTAGQSMGNYTYSYFAATANSTFPVLLGAANKTLSTRKGAMNDSYTVIDNINENIIGSIGRNVDNFSLTSASLSGSLTSGVYSVNEILSNVVDLDDRLE
jgi:hypothetical protein